MGTCPDGGVRGPQEGPGRGREHGLGERRAWGSIPPQHPQPPLEHHTAHLGGTQAPGQLVGGGPVAVRALLPCSPSSGCTRPPGAPARQRPESRPTPLPLRDPSPHLSACPEPSIGRALGQPPTEAPCTPRTKAALSTTLSAGATTEVPGQEAPAHLCPRTPSPGTPDGVRRAVGRDDRERPACPPPGLHTLLHKAGTSLGEHTAASVLVSREQAARLWSVRCEEAPDTDPLWKEPGLSTPSLCRQNPLRKRGAPSMPATAQSQVPWRSWRILNTCAPTLPSPDRDPQLTLALSPCRAGV